MPPKPARIRRVDAPGFDITVERVIARVSLDNMEGDLNPVQAAFAAIADASVGNGEEGVFAFTVPADMMAPNSAPIPVQIEVKLPDLS